MLINIHTHHSSINPYEIVNSEQILTDKYFSVGVLPIEAMSPYNFETIEHISTHKNCIALGEIGLDKTYTMTLSNQIELFIKQVFISEKNKLPIILHCVKSWNEILLLKNDIKPNQPWVFHGFRKTTLLESLLQNNIYISIGTAVLWDKKLQECIPTIPLERLFIETDNDTVNTLSDVYLKICALKNISLQTLEEQIYLNTKNIFKKWEIG